MRQFATIAGNAFMELIRQPVFLLLLSVSSLFEVFLACINYFGFGDEPKLVKNSALAVMFLAGLFARRVERIGLGGREIRSGTALAVLAKPVGRAQFLLAKYAGLSLRAGHPDVSSIASPPCWPRAWPSTLMAMLIIRGWECFAGRWRWLMSSPVSPITFCAGPLCRTRWWRW